MIEEKINNLIKEIKKKYNVSTHNDYNLDYDNDYNKFKQEYDVFVKAHPDYIYYMKITGGSLFESKENGDLNFGFYGFDHHLIESIFTGPPLNEDGYFLFSELMYNIDGNSNNQKIFFFYFHPNKQGVFLKEESNSLYFFVCNNFTEFLEEINSREIIKKIKS
jgi:hypothetical protein